MSLQITLVDVNAQFGQWCDIANQALFRSGYQRFMALQHLAAFISRHFPIPWLSWRCRKGWFCAYQRTALSLVRIGSVGRRRALRGGRASYRVAVHGRLAIAGPSRRWPRRITGRRHMNKAGFGIVAFVWTGCGVLIGFGGLRTFARIFRAQSIIFCCNAW